MSLRKMYHTDTDLEQSGIEFQIGDATFRLARSGGSNRRYQKIMERLTKPYRRQIQSNTMDDKLAMSLAQEGFARGVLLGWDGVTMDDLGDDGNDERAPFNVENAIKLFTLMPDLYSDLQVVSAERAVFLHEAAEEDAGN